MPSTQGHTPGHTQGPTPGPTQGRAEIRRQARARRKNHAASLTKDECRQLAMALSRQVLPHLGTPHGEAPILASYAETGSEISPRPLEEAAAALGWQIAFPRIMAKESPLAFFLSRREALAAGPHGIPEPRATSPGVTPAVLLVPLLAVDRAGQRLGQGGGYYDRTLATLRAKHKIVAIGLAFDMQIVPEVMEEPWDEPLDALATPSGFYLPQRISRVRP